MNSAVLKKGTTTIFVDEIPDILVLDILSESESRGKMPWHKHTNVSKKLLVSNGLTICVIHS